mgnify:FL=1
MELIKKKDKKENTTLKLILKHKNIYIMLIPIILFYIVFYYVPMLGNIIAFQDYKITRGIMKSDFVGFKHFSNFLNDVYFWRLLKNTLRINIYGLIFWFPTPIIFALMLNEVRSEKFKKAAQTITYMPHFISTVVICSMVTSFVSSDGIINSIIVSLGGEPIGFLTDPKYFVGVYTVSDIWQEMGWSSIIYLSALSSIDQQLYEAASIDGASRWKQTIHITIPGILPTISIILIMTIGKMLSIGFEKVMLLYNPAIYETADTISTYVYRQGILSTNYSYSTAVGLFNSIINLILLVFANETNKRTNGNGLF